MLSCQVERERREQYDRTLKAQGWKVRAVPRDGNCFLVAFLLLTLGEQGAREVHRFRHAIVAAAVNFPGPARTDPGFPFYSGSGVVHTFDQHIEYLSRRGVFFDHLSILVRAYAVLYAIICVTMRAIAVLVCFLHLTLIPLVSTS
jgi:hypothetical protein